MAKKKNDKRIPGLMPSFEDILVCRKNNNRNLMEIFVEHPENITQESLGTLAGILEVSDESPDSHYIVNYLVSVIKKEYYSKFKRGAIESFEAALNKANLALAKLAEHGNVNWLGKINAIVLVIEKNNIHLSQTGNAKALLLRGKVLTDISEGAQIPENPSPFKTFIDVLSGRLEKDDLLVISTDAIFEIFSFEEIKRSALKFSHQEFNQFLKTALGNELEKATVLITRMLEEKIPEEDYSSTSKNNEFNAFSQSAFSKVPKKQEQKILETEEKQALALEIKEDLKKESDEFIDKKTGHIYIKEDLSFVEKNRFLENIFENIRVKTSDFYRVASKKVALISQEIVSLFSRPEKTEEVEVKVEINTPEIEKETKEVIPVPVPEEPKKPLIEKEKIISALKNSYLVSKNFSLTAFHFTVSFSKKIFIWLKNFIPQKNVAPSRELSPRETTNAYLTKRSVFENIRPRYSKIKETFLKLDYPQKVYAVLIILFILIIPYFIVKIQNKNSTENQTSEENTPIQILPLENDKNVVRIDSINQIIFKENLRKIINLKGEMFFIASDSLTSAKDQKNYPFPEGFSELKIVSIMDDLNLIFLIDKNNKITSWSPISKKFQDQPIEIPSGSNLTLAKTYLTYLYLLDENNNQIYRYPRAGDGFGEKINWLRENLNLKNISDMAINENIFLIQNGNIIKFFKNKKQDFRLENTTTMIEPDKLYTSEESQNLYVLDKKNSRIVKLDNNGNIIVEYYNLEISNTTDFEVNEQTNSIYFLAGNEVKNFEMKQ